MSGARHPERERLIREVCQAVQRRLPAGLHRVQEAFTSDHRRPILVKVNDLRPDTFYLFDEIIARALADAAIERATERAGGRLTVSFTYNGELRASLHRLQRVASKLDGVRVLTLELPQPLGELPPGVRCYRVAGTPLMRYRVVIAEAPQPLMFISRDRPDARLSDNPRSLGFFTFDPETITDVLDDIDQLLQGLGTDLYAFRQLEVLHKTTQQINRQLENYSRRIDQILRRAQRRPDLMTPARFNRVMQQAVAKMEELRSIPRRALRSIGNPQA